MTVGPTFAPIIHAGTSLQRALVAIGLSEGDASSMACRVADEGFASNRQIVSLTSKLKTFRTAGRSGEAVRAGLAVADEVEEMSDWPGRGRDLLKELAACAAEAGELDQSVALASLSLADLPGLHAPDWDDIQRGLAEVGVGCLEKAASSTLYAHGLAAVVTLGRGIRTDAKFAAYIRRYALRCNEVGAPSLTPANAVTWLEAAMVDATERSRSTPVNRLLEVFGVGVPTFVGLFRMLQVAGSRT